MTRKILKLAGVSLVLAGLFGGAAPHAWGLHLSFAHNLVHLATGALCVYFGFRVRLLSARTFARLAGALYGALGLAGYIFGRPGLPTIPTLPPDERLLRVWPGVLELGASDHFLHVALGILLLAAGFAKPPAPTRPEPRVREKEPALR